MWSKTYLLGLGAGLLLGLSQAEAASFDCAKVRSRVETLICQTENLSALDDELNRNYKQLAAQTDASALRMDQLAWMQARNQCKDAACLAESYKARLKFLSTWKDADPAPGDLSGLYGTRHPSFIHNPDTQKDEPVDMWDCMALKRQSDTEIGFKFMLFGANAHSCEMEGVARRKNGSTFEYRELTELGDGKAECRLSLNIHKGYVELQDTDQNCRRNYCGMRAGISGAAFARGSLGARQCGDLKG